MNTESPSRFDPATLALLKKRGIDPDPMPNTDQLILLFLRDNHVDVRIPPGTTPADALSGAFFGAAGVAEWSASHQLEQQERIAALLEWDRWRRWALCHSELIPFKVRTEKEFNETQAEIGKLLGSEEFQSELIQRKRAERGLKQKLGMVLLASFLSLLGFALVQGLLGSDSDFSRFSKGEDSTPGLVRPIW